MKLLGCKAGLIVSGYWCPTLWISLVRVLVSGFPFICLPLWLVVSESPRASLHLSPFICFPLWLVVSCCPDVFSLVSLGSQHFLLASPVSQLMCLQSSVCLAAVVSDSFPVCHNLSPTPHSYVSPSGCVLFLFHHDFICDWSLSLFFSPCVSSCCPRSYTSIDPR